MSVYDTQLLEVSGNPEEETIGGFQRNEENPLDTDVLIIDDMISSGESVLDVA